MAGEIALAALAGQLAATIVAVEFLKIRLPISGMVTIIAVTGFSNLFLQGWTRRRVPGWVVPAVLMLDVCLLTALLLCAGGRANPFWCCMVDVAMAVVTLAEGWSWLVVGETAVCYGLLFWWPTVGLPVPDGAGGDAVDRAGDGGGGDRVFCWENEPIAATA